MAQRAHCALFRISLRVIGSDATCRSGCRRGRPWCMMGTCQPKTGGVWAAVLSKAAAGRTIIGTSALELGIDLPDLDVVLMDQLLLVSLRLLQRLGRVGRRAGSAPGLCVLCLDHSPLAQRLADSPGPALSTSTITGMSLPLHLEHVRLRAMKAF